MGARPLIHSKRRNKSGPRSLVGVFTWNPSRVPRAQTHSEPPAKDLFTNFGHEIASFLGDNCVEGTCRRKMAGNYRRKPFTTSGCGWFPRWRRWGEGRGGDARVRCWPDRAVWLVKAYRACAELDLVPPRRGRPKGQSKLKGHEAATILAAKH